MFLSQFFVAPVKHFIIIFDLCIPQGTNVKRGTAAVFHELKILIRNEGFQSLSKGIFQRNFLFRSRYLNWILGLFPRLCMAVPVATLESIFYEVTLSLCSKNQKSD
jgi:hypothetical protein